MHRPTHTAGTTSAPVGDSASVDLGPDPVIEILSSPRAERATDRVGTGAVLLGAAAALVGLLACVSVAAAVGRTAPVPTPKVTALSGGVDVAERRAAEWSFSGGVDVTERRVLASAPAESSSLAGGPDVAERHGIEFWRSGGPDIIERHAQG